MAASLSRLPSLTCYPAHLTMRTELKDVDGRDAAAFVQDIIDDLEITNEQADKLKRVCEYHEMKVRFWRDESNCDNVGPEY